MYEALWFTIKTMALQPTCEKCGQELNEFGAILLGPPNENSEVLKLHLCQLCYTDILEDILAGGV